MNIKKHTHTSLGVILTISQMAESQGDINTALKYERLYSKLANSISKAEQELLIQRLKQEHKAQQTKEEYEKLHHSFRLTTIIYLLLCVIASISAMWAISRHKRKNAQRIAEYQAYIEQADLQQNQLQEKYRSIQQQISKQNMLKAEEQAQLLEVLQNRIESLRQIVEIASVYGVGDNSRFYNKFQEHIQLSRSKNRELRDDITIIADMIHNGIISYLKEKYPSLTNHELCYCGFITLGFSPESIRVLYNHSNTNSLYTLRGKIRSKLELGKIQKELELYLLELAEELGTKKK